MAIIAVLVAISIPIFSSQLEKAREATDAANIRAAYAEVASAALTDSENTSIQANVTLKQQQDGWQDNTINIAGVSVDDINANKGANVVVQYVPSDGTNAAVVTIDGKNATASFIN